MINELLQRAPLCPTLIFVMNIQLSQIFVTVASIPFGLWQPYFIIFLWIIHLYGPHRMGPSTYKLVYKPL